MSTASMLSFIGIDGKKDSNRYTKNKAIVKSVHDCLVACILLNIAAGKHAS